MINIIPLSKHYNLSLKIHIFFKPQSLSWEKRNSKSCCFTFKYPLLSYFRKPNWNFIFLFQSTKPQKKKIKI